jgi:hypothetical protein
VTEGDTTKPYLDPRDLEYAQTLAGDERRVVVSTVTRFRRPDQLHVGDALPQLELMRLEDGTRVRLESVATDRPLVIVFGSFT